LVKRLAQQLQGGLENIDSQLKCKFKYPVSGAFNASQGAISGFIARGSSTPSARNQEIVAAIRAVTEKMKDGTGEEKKPKITKPPLRTVH
jgi:hypothetical protein